MNSCIITLQLDPSDRSKVLLNIGGNKTDFCTAIKPEVAKLIVDVFTFAGSELSIAKQAVKSNPLSEC